MINVVKSQPAPAGLAVEKAKPNGTYRIDEVITQLKKDFFNKCYLCEEKEIKDINVEHLVPHQGDIDLKFDWNNLFWSCSYCNNIKLHHHNNLLDCTNENEKILDLIKFDIKPFPKEKAVITPIGADVKTNNTVQLLDAIYNGTTLLKIEGALNLRQKLVIELSRFGQYLRDYFYQEGLSDEDKLELKARIRRSLSKEASFTAFKVWIIKDNQALLEEFGDLI